MTSDLSRITYPESVAKFFEKFLEPLRIAAGLNAYNDLTSELRVKGTILVMKVFLVNLTVSSIAVTDGLKTCMKINTTIYCHGRLL
jgi:hypothetical protein